MKSLTLRKAIKTGSLYERQGMREIAVIPPNHLTFNLIDCIQLFRGEAYGGVEAVRNGRNLHSSDAVSTHIILVEEDRLIGTVRYEQLKHSAARTVELGGFVVAKECRRGRATLLLVQKVREYALSCGDQRFFASASVEFGSASILRKFGARTIAQYFEPNYQRNVERVEIFFGAENATLAA
jgi:hypothetical protein